MKTKEFIENNIITIQWKTLNSNGKTINSNGEERFNKGEESQNTIENLCLKPVNIQQKITQIRLMYKGKIRLKCRTDGYR